MANEVLAAVIQGGCGLIQGGCTIFAAGIAVRGALAGLKNWQMEVPGKRRLELAESCLSLAYNLQYQIAAYGSNVELYVIFDFTYDNKYAHERRSENYRSISESRVAIQKELSNLSSLTRMADVYFSEPLLNADMGLSEYFDYWNDILSDLQRIDTSTPEGIAERHRFCEEIETIQSNKSISADRELFHKSTEMLDELLKPHLGVLANPRDWSKKTSF